MRPRTSLPMRGPPSTLCDVLKHGFFHQVRLLVVSGVNIESRDAMGRTPIIQCAFLEPAEWGTSLAMTLLEHGARVNQRDRSGRNVLHFACIYERKALVSVLLGAIDFDLNQADKAGNTALHYAAMSGNVAITRQLVQTLRRYRIAFDKVNHHGKTALEEAFFTGNGGCARMIEQEISPRHPESAMKDVRFASNVLRLTNTNNTPLSVPVTPTSARRTMALRLRPSSSAAFFMRRESTSSSITSGEDSRKNMSLGSKSRSTLSLHVGGYIRKSQNPLYAYGYRKDEELIPCAPENDFRNKPDYVFKMVHMPFDPCEVQPEMLRDSTNCASNSCGETSSTTCSPQTFACLTDWRRDFKLLYQVYENQCSLSWRAGRTFASFTSVEHDPSCHGPAEDGEDIKGRRGRRSSVVSGSSGGPSMRRRLSASRMKRQTSSARSPVDSALDTSSESINSLASSKKREAGPMSSQGAGRSGPA